MHPKFEISLWKQIIFIYIPFILEVVAHFVGHYLIALLKPLYSELSIEYASIAFHIVMWVLLFYGIVHIAIEFLHSYGNAVNEQSNTVRSLIDTVHKLNLYFVKVRQMQDALVQLNAKSPIGLVKKIEEPDIWEFTNKIFGWNPNWSIELSDTNHSTKKLREIHKERIASNLVTKIEYIFFEDYKIDDASQECFGSQDFLEFLNTLKDEYCQNDDCINNTSFNKMKTGISKYEIWVIPKAVYTAPQHPCFNYLNKYINFIFLYGHRENASNNMLIFVNAKGFVVNGCHNYYIEIFHGNQIYSDFTNHFNNTTRELRKPTSGISPKKVVFSDSSRKFELIDL